MNGFCRRSAVKVICMLFVVILSGLCVIAAGATIFMYTEGYYYDNIGDFYDTRQFQNLTRDAAENVYYHWMDNRNPGGQTDDWYPEADSNFAYTITHYSYPDNILAYNYHPTGNVRQFTYQFGRFVVSCSVSDPITKNDSYYEGYHLFRLLYPNRYNIPVCAAGGLVLVIVSLIILIVGAGRHLGVEEVVLNWQDRIPFDLYLLLGGFSELMLIAFAYNTITYYDYWGWIFGGWITMVICCVGTAMLLSTITRLKAGKWWRNTVLYHILRGAKRCVRMLVQMAVALLRAMPLIWKVLLGFCGAVFVNYVLLFSAFQGWGVNGFPLFMSLVINLALFLGVGFAALNMQKLKQAGEQLAAGDFEQRVDKRWMVMDFLQHAENLDSIGDGMAIAVQQRIRSERLKTELITNVSHDIKTPLTSIINYVDLLKKEPLPEKATEYIGVLDRHTKRLKKMTEDIVEASKASTGNLPVALQKTNLCELVNQSVGEYAEQLECCGLEPVVSIPDAELFVMADGKLLWRVFDNLLGNVCKYAQPGTRVYIAVQRQENSVVVSIKNISRERLNVEADELIERFARGDASRTTDGSGLGLNIAQSLVELQRGGFHLAVDGDLFKAELRFARID